MQIGRYHIKSPTVALFIKDDGLLGIRMVSAGAIVTVDGSGPEDDKLIDVIWDGRKVMMFTRDLQSRAELDRDSQSPVALGYNAEKER
jgi:hypothetical protein